MGILRISVDHTVRIAAQSARVQVVVRGSSSIGADVVTRRATLIREIVADLERHGVAAEAIEVTGVHLGTREGRLLNSSTIEVRLAVAATSEQLPGVLGALSDRAGVTVEHVEWVYDQFEASIPATAHAMELARRKADAVAAAAGLSVTGIANVSDSWSLPSPRPEFGAADAMLARSAAPASAPLDLGLELGATTELSVHLSVDFELSS